MGAVLFAFACGISIGALIGRRSVRPSADDASSPGPAPGRPWRERATGPRAPTSKGRKAGLTEESFQPADDILDRLRKAAEGELDPSTLEPEPGAPTPEQDEPPVPSDLTIAEQRVLDRLRNQRPEGSG